MNLSGRVSFDISMARLAKKLVIVCLTGIAILPAALWLVTGAVQKFDDGNLSSLISDMAISTAFIALVSITIALGLWVFVFAKPVRGMQRAETHLRATKMRDPLTGLINRSGFILAIENALTNRAETQDLTAIFLLDIDRFRLLNHSFGRPVGDGLLQRAADRIRTVVRGGDLLARVSVDQFAIKVEGIADTQGLIVMARNILRACAPGYLVGGHEAVMTLSIGIAIARQESETIDSILNRAEVALRKAKSDGGNCFRLHENWMQGDDAERLKIETRLRQALARDEFKLVYQPLVKGDGSGVSAIEVLLRWHDAVNGVVAPDEFLPYLESSGEIIEVGTWVLRNACSQCRQLMDKEYSDLKVSVNVSPRQFVQEDFVTTVESILAETGFPSSQLQLEITESLLLDPSPETFKTIDALSNLGISLVLDDFGKGYSSMTYLKQFPLHGLKIDRLFISDTAESERDTAIIQAIVDLGHGLGMHVTAEGVETPAQFHLLQKLGCDTLQGYLFSKPVDLNQLVGVLRRLSSESVNRTSRQETIQNSLLKSHKLGLAKVNGSVRIIRNDEVLAQSENAVRLIEKSARTWETVLLVPDVDVRVALSQTNKLEQPQSQASDDQPVEVDLVSQEGQILHARIARVYHGLLSDGSGLKAGVAFSPDIVTIEELPLRTTALET